LPYKVPNYQIKSFFLTSKKYKHKNMIIRKGNPQDMEAVLGLIQELAAFENEPEAVLITVDDLIRDGFGPVPLFHVFVAEVENQIVGIALYYYRYSTWKGKTIHLEDLVVKDKMRGTGLGYALYSEIIKQGKKDKVRRVEWNVLDWNTPAIEFYEKSGAKILDDWKVAQMSEEAINFFVDNKLKNI
jgi:GNAT superfamily N-acetyltransferase